MWYLVSSVAALAIAAFSTTAMTHGEIGMTEPARSEEATSQEQSVASAKEFLLASAATDFHANFSVEAIRFHNVRIGHVTTSEGARQYMLCGEFSLAQHSVGAERTPFATIKTSDYEQWIGAQSVGLCQRESLIWDGEDDLSSSLQSRFDTLARGVGDA